MNNNKNKDFNYSKSVNSVVGCKVWGQQELWANAHDTRESLFTGNLGLSPPISSQFTLLQPKNVKNSLKLFIFRVKSQSRSSNVDNPKKPVASACYDKQHVCAYLQPFSR